MPYDAPYTTFPSFDLNADSYIGPNSLMDKLLREKRSASEFQLRRHIEWQDNYELYRGKVKTNRLTQRQVIMIPLMKETIKTLLAKIDEPPSLKWEELGGDQSKEMVMQAMWDDAYDKLNLEGIDIQDKKNVLLYGRGFKKLNFTKEGMDIQIIDPYDIVVDPSTDPGNIESARFVIHRNIFRSLKEVLADEKYDAVAKERLKIWVTQKEGIVQSSKNKKEWEDKMLRLRLMGITNTQFPLWAGGDVLLNLCEHYTQIWDITKKEWVRHVVTYADDKVALRDKTLEEVIGVDFYPIVTWGEDIETQDFWCDGAADIVRVPNKVINVWFSQMTENRTLKNFQMHWYDATIQGYQPQTYEPGPGRMLPAPGDPNKTIMPVNVDGLDDTEKAIEYLKGIVESGTFTTAMSKGLLPDRRMSDKMFAALESMASQPISAITMFYRRAWEELGMKWYAMIDANQYGKMTLYKTNHQGKVFPKTFYRKDWVSQAGYRCHSSSSSERDANNTKFIQTSMLVKSEFPGNPALEDIIQKRMLEALDLTPEEMHQVSDAQKKLRAQQAEAAAASSGGPPGQGGPGNGPSPTATSPMAGMPGVSPTPALPGAGSSVPEHNALMDEIRGMLK